MAGYTEWQVRMSMSATCRILHDRERTDCAWDLQVHGDNLDQLFKALTARGWTLCARVPGDAFCPEHRPLHGDVMTRAQFIVAVTRVPVLDRLAGNGG